MNIAEIINKGISDGKSYAEINKELEGAGCAFRLVETGKNGWTEQEFAEGFKPGDKPVTVPHIADVMERDTDKAGKIIPYVTKEGHYNVYYDIDGYAVKAVKC